MLRHDMTSRGPIDWTPEKEAARDAKDAAPKIVVDTRPSEIIVHTGNGHGSINTKIRRFTTLQSSIGSDIIYTDSATLGAEFKINTDGFYSIYYHDYGLGTELGVTLNSSELNVSVQTLVNIADRVMFSSFGSSAQNGPSISITFPLSVNDVIRPHNGPSLPSGTIDWKTVFRINKVGNL